MRPGVIRNQREVIADAMVGAYEQRMVGSVPLVRGRGNTGEESSRGWVL